MGDEPAFPAKRMLVVDIQVVNVMLCCVEKPKAVGIPVFPAVLKLSVDMQVLSVMLCYMEEPISGLVGCRYQQC